jgi:pimeloyl-ACP methyl ester carboxylesterase
MIEKRRHLWGVPLEVSLHLGRVTLDGTLSLPEGARGAVLFAHGSGSGHRSPRNVFVAERLRDRGLGTLLADLLTPEEDVEPDLRFDIPFLIQRLKAMTDWFFETVVEAKGLRVGYFGASTGAAAALGAAADLGPRIQAVVSRGGRPDLVENDLGRVRAPTLFLVGEDDHPVLDWNRRAFSRLNGPRKLVVIPGAGHLFEEPGALERVADEAAGWFEQHLEEPGARP